MNRQHIFDNIVKLNGHGRAWDESAQGCLYFLKGEHPGCGIGCQPGFSEKFQSLIEDSYRTEDSIFGLLENSDFGDDIETFFGVQTDEDKHFLNAIQRTHDREGSWNDDQWDREVLQEFCTEWLLDMPDEEE